MMAVRTFSPGFPSYPRYSTWEEGNRRLRAESGASAPGGADVGEDGGGAVGVVGVVEGGVANEFLTDDGHGQTLEADAGQGPGVGEAVGQAGPVVALDADDDGVGDFVHADGAGRPHLVGAGDGGDVQHAPAGLFG